MKKTVRKLCENSRLKDDDFRSQVFAVNDFEMDGRDFFSIIGIPLSKNTFCANDSKRSKSKNRGGIDNVELYFRMMEREHDTLHNERQKLVPGFDLNNLQKNIDFYHNKLQEELAKRNTPEAKTFAKSLASLHKDRKELNVEEKKFGLFQDTIAKQSLKNSVWHYYKNTKQAKDNFFAAEARVAEADKAAEAKAKEVEEEEKKFANQFPAPESAQDKADAQAKEGRIAAISEADAKAKEDWETKQSNPWKSAARSEADAREAQAATAEAQAATAEAQAAAAEAQAAAAKAHAFNTKVALGTAAAVAVVAATAYGWKWWNDKVRLKTREENKKFKNLESYPSEYSTYQSVDTIRRDLILPQKYSYVNCLILFKPNGELRNNLDDLLKAIFVYGLDMHGLRLNSVRSSKSRRRSSQSRSRTL